MTNVELIEAIRNSLPSHLAWTEVDESLLQLAHDQAADLDALMAAAT